MNNLFIFDLDGVLIETTDIHFECLNKALNLLSKDYVISYEDHIKLYNGLPTKEKLKILTIEKNLPIEKYEFINNQKQIETIKKFNSIATNRNLIKYFKLIKNKNIKIAVASNCIRESVKIALLKLNLIEYVDIYLSNEDILKPKPYPEIYWKCMTFLNSIPNKTVIFEDSKVGILGASYTHANLVKVDSKKLVTLENIEFAIKLLIK